MPQSSASPRGPRKPPKSAKPADKGRARAALQRPALPGWKTTDQDELALRRWRGRTDLLTVVPLDPEQPIFGAFRAQSATGSAYEVEIRSLAQATNSCGCIDHRVNGLGTCKHIEGVLEALRRRGARAFRQAAAAGSPRIEIYLDRRDGALPTMQAPQGESPADAAPARLWLAPFLAPDGTLPVDPDRIAALVAAWREAPAEVRRAVRVSAHFGPWLDRLRRVEAREAARRDFLAAVDAGTAEIDVLRHKLLPYQREGALHLAFGERALLADDMGLGKTVQAIAACELLVRQEKVRRVLIVCPASLKAEWEEQIARFTGRPVRLVFGNRAERLAAYRAPELFTIANYEQVVIDAADINAVLAPDVVVLDEAQRIKNWHTKTARQVKSLASPYAFVLTGTPVENRIDELYSIIQFLDPEILGPLFRFNRDFYQLDERGRPMDYKNLADLRARLQPVMLRRRKAEVETQLPGRTVKTFFVPMAEEQKLRYEDYRMPASRLIAQAQKRPLTQAEFDRLQQLLACMRMVCDTPAILDPTCRVCPKLEELEGILGDLLEDPERKIIVFSEWERMLALVRELAGEMGVEVAWHTGSVPQQRRRAEINRFKQDPACRLFLSTDSGSVGLNLQAASAVINLDLPWNPAKLEQRIARAWRKHQTRSVTVINLVAENTIEHSILHLLAQKQALADGVLDGSGDLAALKMPSGRGAFIERMEAMMQARQAPARIVAPEEAAAEALRQRHGEKILLVEARAMPDASPRLLAILDLDEAGLAAEAERLAAEGGSGAVPVEIVGRAAWLAMQQLAAKGLLHFAEGPARTLHRAAGFAEPPKPPETVPPSPDEGLLAEADRALRMAKVLADGGFPEEAPPLLAKAFARGVAARQARWPEPHAAAPDAAIRHLVARGLLPAQAILLDDALRGAEQAPGGDVGALLAATGRFLAALAGQAGRPAAAAA